MDFQWPTKLGSKSSPTAHLFMAALILFDQIFKEKSRSKNAVEWMGGRQRSKVQACIAFFMYTNYVCLYVHKFKKRLNNN